MNKQQIKDLALSNGFKLKQQPSGEMDLNPYVYDFVEALLAKANERVKRLELIAKGLCYTEGTVRGDKAYSEWVEYQEQLRKEQE